MMCLSASIVEPFVWWYETALAGVPVVLIFLIDVNLINQLIDRCGPVDERLKKIRKITLDLIFFQIIE